MAMSSTNGRTVLPFRPRRLSERTVSVLRWVRTGGAWSPRSSATAKTRSRADKGHGGIDLGAPKGTSIRAALPGTVYVVRYANSGYGYHVMIDHGGGFVTLYAHCSKIFATEGQQVEAGTVIAEVGSTGRSTGNHLHFEVRIAGEKQNPRSYLP